MIQMGDYNMYMTDGWTSKLPEGFIIDNPKNGIQTDEKPIMEEHMHHIYVTLFITIRRYQISVGSLLCILTVEADILF